jgi:serine protease
VVPKRGTTPSAVVAPRSAAAPNDQLAYRGGTGGIGVTTAPPKVYVVYWGATTQWGTSSTDAQGYLNLSMDTLGLAHAQQAFLKGVGTGGETWSGVMTQYCEGIASGVTSCPSGSQHVGYPTGGALAGVWADTSATPGQATQTQLAQEANNAAAHFGNTTAASNRNVQYVITSPSGTHPDGFNTASTTWCAWHDHTADPAVGSASPYGDLAFTNMPYVLDLGASCGQNFVNGGSTGNLDGVTIIGGHEYAETITDQSPNSNASNVVVTGGWADSLGNENGDKCAWISSGQGASQNITLSTGTFAVQSTWANDFGGNTGGCEVTHPIVTSAILGAPTAVTAGPGNGFADVHWQPPTIAQRGPVVGYVILTTRNGAGAGWQFVAADVRQVSVPSLTNGTAYSVSVQAVDTSGGGIASTPVSVTPSASGSVATVPPAPAGSFKAGDGFVTGSWSAPATDGGAPIAAYSVIALDGGGTVRGWQNVSSDVRSASVDGLTNGTAYTVEVVAWNSKGASAALKASAQPAPGTASTGPQAPLWFAAAPGAAGAAGVSWGPPPGDGGAPVKGYSVIASRAGSVVAWVNVGSPARSTTLTGLPSGADVNIIVVGVNGRGFGTAPSPATVHIG